MTHCTDTISPDWHRMQRRTGRILGRLAKWTGYVQLWSERVAERRQLLALNDRMLKDIGISRADAANEADKPFWKR